MFFILQCMNSTLMLLLFTPNDAKAHSACSALIFTTATVFEYRIQSILRRVVPSKTISEINISLFYIVLEANNKRKKRTYNS